ncbi:hypothetical protein [Hydrogenobaculum acidophilum]
MEKKTKNYRLSDETIAEIKDISNMLNITETEVVTRAVHMYYLSVKNEEQNFINGAIVPLAQYQEVRDRLEQVIYRLGEAQGEIKEKDKIIQAKEEVIQFLKDQLNKQNEKLENRKRWWRWWSS